MHLLRRNLNCQFLLFNNEIYGLTKGQYSPTSRVGTRSRLRRRWARSTVPANPCAFALGSGARFVARGIDVNKNLVGVLKAALCAQWCASFVEIFQNCIVYNDDVFAPFHRKGERRGQTSCGSSTASRSLFAGGTKGSCARYRHADA